MTERPAEHVATDHHRLWSSRSPILVWEAIAWLPSSALSAARLTVPLGHYCVAAACAVDGTV